MSDALRNLFETIFTPEKVREDLFAYLKEMMPDLKDGKGWNLHVTEESGLSDGKEIYLTPDEQLTIIRYRAGIDFDYDAFYKVAVAVGEYDEPDELGFYYVEFCEAVLLYDAEYNCTDVEFSYSIETEEDDDDVGIDEEE